MVMGKKKKGGEVRAEIGVGRGGIGGIHMAKRGRIEGIGRGIDHIADWGIGRERGIRIGGSAREAMREEEMTSGHPDEDESGVTLQTHRDDGGIHVIETMITEDELDLLYLFSCGSRFEPLRMSVSNHPRKQSSTPNEFNISTAQPP